MLPPHAQSDHPPRLYRLYWVLEGVKALGGVGTVFLAAGAFAWAIYSFRLQDQNVKRQVLLQELSLKQQQQTTQQQRDSEDAKLAAGLIAVLGCRDELGRQTMALELLRSTAPQHAKMIALVLQEQCYANRPSFEIRNRQLEEVRKQSDAADQREQLETTVDNARQFEQLGYYADAARIYDDARNLIPKTYINSGIINMTEVEAARKALENSRFKEASDLFSRAFRKVARPEAAIRRRSP